MYKQTHMTPIGVPFFEGVVLHVVTKLWSSGFFKATLPSFKLSTLFATNIAIWNIECPASVVVAIEYNSW